MATYTHNIGNLTNTAIQGGDLLNDYWTEDHYTFNISNSSSINLNLHNITMNDDADLKLYRDVNANGVLDGADEFLQSSTNLYSADDSINYFANAGSYIAVVERYALGSQDRLDYELDLSATHQYRSHPNLLPDEFEVGELSTPTSFTGRETTSYYGWVGNANTADTYVFSLRDIDGFDPQTFRFYRPRVNISLTGLSSDADIRIIRDSNNNDIIDSGEVIVGGSSTNGGTSSELISGISIRGDELIVQVYQYSGDTNYQLNFESYWGRFIS